MLKQTLEAEIRSIVRISIHDQPYIEVTYSPVNDQERQLQTRIGSENAYPELTQGDRVTIHAMMGVVTKIERSEDRDE